MAHLFKRSVLSSSLFLVGFAFYGGHLNADTNQAVNVLSTAPLMVNTRYDQAVELLAKQVSGFNYVALGEQSHGAATVFSFKRDVVKQLHQQYGFDVLALESGLFDVDWLYRQFLTHGESIKENAPRNIFYMYANSAEMKPLFEYIEASHKTKRPLKLVGFDSQHSGGVSVAYLVSELGKALAPFNSEFTQAQWQQLAVVIQRVIELSSTAPADPDAFFKQFDALINHVKHIKQRSDFWQRIVAGLKSQAQRQWQMGDPRSHEMGNNLVWLSEQHPKAKMMIWAHTYHLEKDGPSEIASAGQVMFAKYQQQYHVTHFTAGSGEYVDFTDMKTKAVPEFSEQSIEYVLNKAECEICIVDAKALSVAHAGKQILLSNYQIAVPLNDFAHKWNSVIYFKAVTPSVQLTQ